MRAGDDVTGASAFRLGEGLDTDPVYGIVTVGVRQDDTTGSLLNRLAVSGAELILQVLDGVAAHTVAAVPQVLDGVSLAPKVTCADAEVGLVGLRGGSRPADSGDDPDPGAWTVRPGDG